MATFAIVGTDNVVTNVIVADTLEEASVLGTAVELTAENDGGYGFTYDPKTKKFTRPVIEEQNA